MKKSTVLRLGFLAGVFLGSAAQGQVFNVHETGQQGFPFYNGYNTLAFGQGVVSDPGNNVWNGFGNGTPGTGWCFGSPHTNDFLLLNNPGNPYAWSHSNPSFASGPNLFSPYGSAKGIWDHNAGNASSAAVHTPITIPVMIYGGDNGSAFEGTNNLARTNVAPFVLSGAAIVNSGGPGIGTSANPLGLMTLSNVPPGTYSLYLFGGNFDGTRGAVFNTSSGTPSNNVTTTINYFAAAGTGPMTNFVYGSNYVVFNNVSPGADTTIHITWAPVSNPVSGASGEGDFNGLQLAVASPVAAAPYINQEPPSGIFSQATTASSAALVTGFPALAYQWYSGSPPGTPVTGQTSNTLTFPNAQASQSGNYFLIATNINGAVTSSVVTLTIAGSPLITAQSSTNALILYSGRNNFTMSVTAFGNAPLYYYWRANGTTAAITTNSGSITFNNITASATYSCLVSNSFGTALNNPLPITVIAPPTTSEAVAILALNPFAYWPLTESGVTSTAYDYIGGNNGTFVGGVNNAQPGPITGFGSPSYAYSFDGTGYLDVPNGPVDLKSSLSLVTWVIPVSSGGNGFQTIAGKGDSSYRTDMDGGGIAHFANSGNNDVVGGPTLRAGPAWHLVVGTYDAVAQQQVLYVDGLPVGQNSAPNATPGNTRDFWIGGAPDYALSRTFSGSIGQVALFNYALSASQVSNLWTAAQAPPFIVSATPVGGSTNGYVGGRVKFTALANGAPTLAYQWSGPGGSIAGATTSALVLNNLNETGSPANGGPGTYFCVVTNVYGTVTSPPVALTVASSGPFLIADLPPTNYGIAGSSAALTVQVGGNEPFTNQWFYNTTIPLHDGDRNGRISGSTNTTLIIANAQTNDDGAYQLFVTNGISPFFASSSVGQLVIENEPRFNGDGSGWTLNGGATIASDLLTLTTPVNGEARSVWFNTPMYIGAFEVSFDYQASGSGGLADGITFCVQNDPAGLIALGGGGGLLGYGGILNSAALCVDLYNVRGYQYVTDGTDPRNTGNYVDTRPAVDTGSGNPIAVSMVYKGNTLSINLTDTVTLGTAGTNMVIGSIPAAVGNTNLALIGFTGATGGVNAMQTISNFTFVPLPSLSLTRNGSGVVLSWPVGVGGFQLQKNSSLTNHLGWTNIPPPYTIVGQKFQTTVTPATGVQFYRLVVTP